MKPDEISEEFNAVMLTSAATNIDAGLIMELLTNNNIPCYKKSKGSGGYMNIYMGYSVYGEDIYVAQKDYEKAKALIYELSEAQEPSETVSRKEYHVPFYRNPRIAARIILAVFIAVIVLSFVLNYI